MLSGGTPLRDTASTGGGGLSFPQVRHWGTFVCEACTVQAILGRELHRQGDWRLLCLERMRIIDMAHSWSKGTHRSYQGKLQVLETFERQFGVPLFRLPSIPHPRVDMDIPLMWCQEAYSLRPGASRLGNQTLSFGTVRQLRGALAHLLSWEAAQTPSLPGYLDSSKRLIHQDCRITDRLPVQLHAQGMSSRMGADPRPSTAILDHHVRSLDLYLSQRFLASTTVEEQRFWALGGAANLTLWLGWLRSRETLELRWEDVWVVPPTHGPTVGLPMGIGMVALKLLPETKTSRTMSADVVIAYETMSGLSLGQWLSRLQSLGPTGSYIFSTPGHTPWSSKFFRHTFLYPHLATLQAQGDPYLSIHRHIPSSFWSLHSYRRGARTQVSRRRKVGRVWTRAALPGEVYEHGRWQKKMGTHPIDLHYQQWTYYDRLQLTLACM